MVNVALVYTNGKKTTQAVDTDVRYKANATQILFGIVNRCLLYLYVYHI